MLVTRSLLLIFYLLVPFLSFTQLTSLPGQLKQNFENYIAAYKPESIYISCDRSVYQEGDTLFFKIYFVEARTNKPISTGSNIFIDLVSPFGKQVRKAILNPAIASTGGYFIIPEITDPGFYTLRSFTRWMAETEPGAIFQKALFIKKKKSGDPLDTKDHPDLSNLSISLPPITENNTGSMYTTINAGSANEPVAVPLKNTGQSLNISFFIEGQQIINGVNNRIAIMAMDRFGRNMKIKGVIRDQYGSNVAECQTNEYGLGSCQFYGIKGKKYTFFIDQDTLHFSYPIGDVKDTAYQLSVVEKNADHTRLRVSLGDALFKNNTRTTLVAVSGNEMVFAANGVDMYEVNLPSKLLKQGITNITLFNERLEPVSERNIFSPPVETGLQYKTGEANNNTITFVNNDSLDMELNLGISDRFFNARYQGNIMTALLLGKCFSNNYEVNEKILADSLLTDILMVCDPETNIQWDRIMTGNYPRFAGSGEQSLNLQGWIQDKNGKPATNRVLAIFSNDYKGKILVDTTDDYGSFTLNNLVYTDTARFILQSRNKKGIKQPDTIYVTENNFPGLPFTPAPLQVYVNSQPVFPAALSKQLHTYDSIAGFENAKELEAVVISKRKSSDSRDKKRISGFSSIIGAEEIMRLGAVNIADALTLLPGVTQNGGFIKIRGTGSLTASAQQMEPLLVIDGTPYPVYDSSSSIRNLLASIPANIVDFIEVLKGGEAAIYGTRGSNGVILVYTKSDFTMGFGWEEPGVKAFQALGYHVPVRKEKKNNINPSGRLIKPTIYWTQDIKLHFKEPVKIRFEKNDIPSNYQLRAEGITGDGNIIYVETLLDD